MLTRSAALFYFLEWELSMLRGVASYVSGYIPTDVSRHVSQAVTKLQVYTGLCSDPVQLCIVEKLQQSGRFEGVNVENLAKGFMHSFGDSLNNKLGLNYESFRKLLLSVRTEFGGISFCDKNSKKIVNILRKDEKEFVSLNDASIFKESRGTSTDFVFNITFKDFCLVLTVLCQPRQCGVVDDAGLDSGAIGIFLTAIENINHYNKEAKEQQRYKVIFSDDSEITTEAL
ncbi:MAG: hypothetical protein V4591_03770 [Bdellovibrionota bacterium]